MKISGHILKKDRLGNLTMTGKIEGQEQEDKQLE